MFSFILHNGSRISAPSAKNNAHNLVLQTFFITLPSVIHQKNDYLQHWNDNKSRQYNTVPVGTNRQRQRPFLHPDVSVGTDQHHLRALERKQDMDVTGTLFRPLPALRIPPADSRQDKALCKNHPGSILLYSVCNRHGMLCAPQRSHHAYPTAAAPAKQHARSRGNPGKLHDGRHVRHTAESRAPPVSRRHIYPVKREGADGKVETYMPQHTRESQSHMQGHGISAFCRMLHVEP